MFESQAQAPLIDAPCDTCVAAFRNGPFFESCPCRVSESVSQIRDQFLRFDGSYSGQCGNFRLYFGRSYLVTPNLYNKDLV